MCGVSYRPDFERFKTHYSGLYFGASIKALIALGQQKGYQFVGCDKRGTSVFFIHNPLASKPNLKLRSYKILL
ncbi:hypothetical protein NHP22001_01020 [Helicobacter sp. NHP22-001]|nr:hypothetical protein NHP22001_01020 [Helicobacter sp. NHP22-001]